MTYVIIRTMAKIIVRQFLVGSVAKVEECWSLTGGLSLACT